jgi:hypothetical protein
MPAKIPRAIRDEVIWKWLMGLRRDKIAKECGISTGMISNIISSAKTQSSNAPEDFDLVRQISLMLKREGLSLDTLASTLRLRSILKDKNLREEQIEQLFDDFDVHFFKKKGVLTEEFVDNIINLSEISKKLNIPIDKLFESVSEKRRENDKLNDEIENKRMMRIVAIQDLLITTKDLEEYKKNRPIIEHCRRLEKAFHLRDLDYESLDKQLKDEKLEKIQEQSYWELNEDELEILNTKPKTNNRVLQPIDPSEYREMVRQLLSSPLKYQNIIPDLYKYYKRLKAESEQTKFFGIADDSNQITN